ncbi:MAG: hypothetical protein QNJ98_06060, partial [Planctomycetota bacterium]|nr:hypothetical protein [Planctomycetota bacterium]
LLDAPIVWNPDDRELARTRIIGKLKLSFAGTPRSDRVDVVRAVLRFYEFDLVRCEPREQPVYVLTRFETPRGQWRPEPLSLDDGALRTAMQQSGRLVACTVPLMVTGRKAERVAESARTLLRNSARAYVGFVPETRSLMLRGDAPRVASVARLLRSAGLVDEAALRR